MAGELKLNNVSVATESGGVVTVNNSVLHNAITMADTWYLSADKTDHNVITANLARWGLAGNFSGFGDAMTQSNGVFTFPETGYYLVTAQGYLQTTSSGGTAYVGLKISYSHDGGTNWNNSQYGYQNMYAASNYSHVTVKQIFVVTNTTTHKLRFEFTSQSVNGRLAGGADLRTNFQFIRLRSI